MVIFVTVETKRHRCHQTDIILHIWQCYAVDLSHMKSLSIGKFSIGGLFVTLPACIWQSTTLCQFKHFIFLQTFPYIFNTVFQRKSRFYFWKNSVWHQPILTRRLQTFWPVKISLLSSLITVQKLVAVSDTVCMHVGSPKNFGDTRSTPLWWVWLTLRNTHLPTC